MLDKHQKSIVSPRIYSLNTELWVTEDDCWKRFGWRWDLTLYNRQHVGIPDSPAISSYCIAVRKDWFDNIGGFDCGIGFGGEGEDIEFSLRSWLFGGFVFVCDDSYIATRQYQHNRRIEDVARIVEAWLPSYISRFLAACDIPDDLKIGRINNLLDFQDKLVRTPEWFFEVVQPELGAVYDLRGIAAGKSIAVVGCGPSMDYIESALINRYDIIIGVDYMGLSFDCDYVVADSSDAVVELKSKYSASSFVVPFFLFDRASASYISTNKVIADSVQFELSDEVGRVSGITPPFCNFEQSFHTAVNFALFLGPRRVTLFGCDNKLIEGKSHSASVGYYDDGCLWSHSDSTRRKFAMYEYGIEKLGKLACSVGIPLIRMNHA